MANKILVARGTKARLEEIKSTLAVNELVYSTDTGELGVKKANGNIEYFMNAADISAIADALETSKQDKLVAGDNITIDENTNVISGDGIDLNTLGYMNYAADIYYKERKQSLFASAWEHSLTLAPSDIQKSGYPNGETEGVIIPQGITIIGSEAFSFWEANNQPLVIPNSVTSIHEGAFRSWTSNNHPLVIPDSVTSIGDSAFVNWNSNTHPLVIPSSVTSISGAPFGGWSQVPYVEIRAITPPTLTHSVAFDFGYRNPPIYVPDESVDAYKTAAKWASLADRIFPISDKLDLTDDIADLQENKQDKLVAVEIWDTATKTLALSDASKLFKCSHIADQTLTIPANATVAFPISTMITFLLTSNYTVTFSGASGVTLTSIDSLVELTTQFAMASLIKTDTDTWQLVGALE